MTGLFVKGPAKPGGILNDGTLGRAEMRGLGTGIQALDGATDRTGRNRVRRELVVEIRLERVVTLDLRLSAREI